MPVDRCGAKAPLRIRTMLELSGDNPNLRALLLQLPAGLRQHVERVCEKALDLAHIYSVDPVKAEVAALAHDLARGMSDTELLRRALSYGLACHPVEEQAPMLLHGPVGAEMLKRECGIGDGEVLEAVRWHTTFNRGLGPVAKIVFLADKLDPHKIGSQPFLEGVDRLAREDLDAAILSFLQESLDSMIRAWQLVHPASLEGRNELLALRKGSSF